MNKLSLPRKYHLPLGREMYLLSVFAYARFGLGDYTRCAQELNTIFSCKNFPGDTTLNDYIRLPHLVMRYERGDADLFESVMRSTYRFLIKRNALHPFEKIFLAFLKKT